MVNKANGPVSITNNILTINCDKTNGPVSITNKILAINGDKSKWSCKYHK